MRLAAFVCAAWFVGCSGARTRASAKAGPSHEASPIASAIEPYDAQPVATVPVPTVRRVDVRLESAETAREVSVLNVQPTATLRPKNLTRVSVGRDVNDLLADGTGSTWWLVNDWRRIAPGLFVAAVVREDKTAPGVVVFDASGHVAVLDADAVITADLGAGLLVAKRGDAPRVYTLAASKDALTVTPMELSSATSPPAWNSVSTGILDAKHLLLGDQSVVELPSLKVLSVLPGNLVAIAENRALVVQSDTQGYITFVVVDPMTGALQKEVAPPKPRYGASVEGNDWMAAFSPRGRMLVIAEPDGIWTLDVDASPSRWKLVSTRSYTGGRYPSWLAVAADESLVCLDEKGVTDVLPIKGRPAIPAGRIEVPLERRKGMSTTCEMAYLPVVPGLSPVATHVEATFGIVIQPRLFDEDLQWVAATYEARSGDLELVVADRSGALVHRTNITRTPENWKQDGSAALLVEAAGGTHVRVVRGFGQDERVTEVDLETGVRKKTWDEVEANAVAEQPPPATPYCLHRDGSLTAASTCEPPSISSAPAQTVVGP